MMILPVSGLLVMPDVNYYFQNDYMEKYMQGMPEVGAEILFLLMKREKKISDMAPEDFWPVGVTGTVTELDSEDHSVSIRTTGRVNVEVFRQEDGRLDAVCTPREEIGDLDEEARAKAFREVQSALLQYISSFQWGIVARNYILRWKTMEEMAAGLSYQLNMTDEEKYRIVEADRISERYQRIEQAVYEFIEVSKVGADAQKAQTESNEKLWPHR